MEGRSKPPERAMKEAPAAAASASMPAAWKRRVAWQPDEEASQCCCCSQDFSITVRRHHCRACGRCVCGSCSGSKMKVAGYEGEERVCDECFERAKPSAAAKACRAVLLLLGCVESPEADQEQVNLLAPRRAK